MDIAYTLSGVFAEVPILRVTMTDRTTGMSCVSNQEALSCDTGTAPGAHYVVWDLTAQGIVAVSADAVFTVAYRNHDGYCVIDL